MKLSLIGMSGSGKSYWSKRLETSGFTRFSIDELIQQHLSEDNEYPTLNNISDVATWMGFPHESRYKNTSARYLALEEEALKNVLQTVKNLPDTQDIIVDTTGSVIHASPKILEALTGATTIVYLETPIQMHRKLYRQYLEDPKPVIWGDKFSQKPDEAPSEALRRCYPELLTFRTQAYETLADHKVAYEMLHNQSLDGSAFVEYLRALEHLYLKFQDP